MIKKTIVYPYSRSFAAYLRHINCNKLYNVTEAVIPGRWWKDNEDAGGIDGGEKIGIPIRYGFEDCLNQCDTVIWASYEYYDNKAFYDTVLSKIEKALELGKNIVCFEELTKKELQLFKEKAAANNCLFIYKENEKYPGSDDGAQKPIDVPIITVTGLTEECSKFDTELNVYRALSAKGYRVLLISSKTNANLLNIYSFPSFMFSPKRSEMGKMRLLRSYIAHLQQKVSPDVIVLGVPGGLLPFYDQYDMHYGIIAYEVFSVLKTDYNVVNVWCDVLDSLIIDKIPDICRYRYGMNVNAIGVSNISLYLEGLQDEQSTLEYSVYDSDMVDKTIAFTNKESNSLKMYNLVKNDSVDKLVDDIIISLSE